MPRFMSGGLEAVFIAERTALLRFLSARGAGDDAEDLLQELWVRLQGRAGGPIADPRSYLFRSANNLMLDRARSERQRRGRDREWARPEGEHEPEGAGAPTSEEVLISREALGEAERELDALGERTARIFLRYRLQGHAQRLIAETEGISLSAVEKHLQKAYRAMIDLRRRSDAD